MARAGIDDPQPLAIAAFRLVAIATTLATIGRIKDRDMRQLLAWIGD